MDVNRLNTGEKIAGAAGLVLFIIMFFSWWGAPDVNVDLGELGGDINLSTGVETSLNAWQAASFLDLIWGLTAILGVTLAALAMTQTQHNLPIALSAVVAGLGILTTVTILYRLIDTPFDLTRKFGVFLGLIAAGALAYGGWKAMEEEGTSFSEQADRVQSRGDSSTSRQDPPPPPSSAS